MAVIQEAWIQGVSTRKVDDLVQAMGMSGISKSQVSELCKGIDVRVNSGQTPRQDHAMYQIVAKAQAASRCQYPFHTRDTGWRSAASVMARYCSPLDTRR